MPAAIRNTKLAEAQFGRSIRDARRMPAAMCWVQRREFVMRKGYRAGCHVLGAAKLIDAMLREDTSAQGVESWMVHVQI